MAAMKHTKLHGYSSQSLLAESDSGGASGGSLEATPVRGAAKSVLPQLLAIRDSGTPKGGPRTPLSGWAETSPALGKIAMRLSGTPGLRRIAFASLSSYSQAARPTAGAFSGRP
jgi:hypothetical protein